MPALLYSGRDAAKRESRGRKTKINDLDTVTGGFPTFQTAKIHQLAQRALEGKVQARLGEAIELLQEKPPRGNSGHFGAQWREPTRNQVGVHEMNHPSILGKKLTCKRSLARAVRSGDDDTDRPLCWWLAHGQMMRGRVFGDFNDPPAF